MAHLNPVQTTEAPLIRDLLDAAQRYLPSRRGLFILAGIAAVATLGLSWSWLVAMGVASVLLAALPCLAMCALGLCMNRTGGRSCSTDTAAPPTPPSARLQASQERRSEDV